MEAARERATDRKGRPLTPGARVRVVGEEGTPEGSVVRVLGDYDVATVLIEQKGKVERMYLTAEMEVL